MSSTLSSPRNSSHPRLSDRRPLSALRPPSTRDIDIYKRVKIQGALQQSVAWHYKLHTSRVCQIVKKVRRWLAAGGAVADPQVRDHAARQSLSKATHMLRLQRAIELVTLAIEGDRPTHKSSRSRTVGGIEVWREETVKPPPDVDLKAIRLLLRLTESLKQLQNHDDGQSASAKPEQSFGHAGICEQELISFVFEHLCQWRAAAEQHRRLPACADIRSLVAGAIDQVLGTNLAADFAAHLASTESATHETLL